MALVRSIPLRRVSPQRAEELAEYRFRRTAFLAAHPYCQVWLREHGVEEAEAIRRRGVLRFGRGQPLIFVPRSAQIHHTRKRRRRRLLEERDWLAVSPEAHRFLENNLRWARARGYLHPFRV